MIPFSLPSSLGACRRFGQGRPNPGHIAAALALLALGGCNEFGLNNDPALDVGVEPDIRVEPVAVDFGGNPLQLQVSRSVRIANAGGAELDVGRILLGPHPSFSLPDPDVRFTIPPGEAVLQEVLYVPVTVSDQSFLTIISDDPDTPELDVPLAGSALVPELTIMPDPLEFGGNTRTCTEEASLDLVNTGLAPLTIDSVIVSGQAYQSVDELVEPEILAPGRSMPWTIAFTPPFDGPEYPGLIRVQSDDPRGPQIGELLGFGEGVPDHTDLFEQVENDWTLLDVMFWVDQSGSMGGDQQNLADNFETFINILLSGGIDYSVIGVTADSGCFNEAIITPMTANPLNVFDRATSGSSGSHTEHGLWGAREVMNKTDPGECNHAWLREDAATVLVIVSDEHDQSPGAWRPYVDAIQGVDPEAVITTVVGQPGSPCAEHSPRYYDASAATGGATLEICSADWGSYFYQIIGVIDPPLSTFVLSHIPDPETIEVSINGELAGGWAYDGELNAVVFTQVTLPPPGAEISVWYEDVVTCPE